MAQAYDQLALPLPDTVDPPLLRRVLSPARTALVTADRHSLAAHLSEVAQLRGRTAVPKPGALRHVAPAITAETAVPTEFPRVLRQRRVIPPSELGPVVRFHAFVRLISVDPAANRFRVYVLSWHPTLWGDFALVQMWGRLGRPSRSQTTSYATRAQAQGLIVRLLRRRLRHGYRVVVWT